MAYSLENTNDLITLANAIRAKTSDTANYSVAGMATAVASISTGGSGHIANKQFYETSNVYEVAGTVQQGSYLDVDTELPRDKEFVFIFTMHNTDGSSSIARNSSGGFERNDYFFLYDGSNFSCLNVPGVTSSSYPKINFELIYDSETETNVVRFNNNNDYATTENGDINLGLSGYVLSDSGYRYVWGQLFYLN